MYQSKNPYKYGTGRRKSSVARVHLFPNGTGAITINGREHRRVLRPRHPEDGRSASPWITTGTLGKVDIVATVDRRRRHPVRPAPCATASARALLLVNPEYRAALKKRRLPDPRSSYEGA